MEILKLILNIIEIIAFAYFAFASCYIALFGFGAYLPRKIRPIIEVRTRKIVVMIPGYKEDMVIVGVAAEALHQDYPKDKYEVVVIADSFKPETLAELRKLPIRVVEVVFEVSKKSKALNKCMEQIGDDFDIAMILDADNVMAPDVLSKINDAFNRGYFAVQGHRMAKNTNTDFAVLDAVSEEINNHIFRKGHRALGLSSALIGSGMGIDYALYKKTMATVDSVGEDKEMEMKLLKQKFVIEYVEDAFVYDEKTQKSEVFINQRRRWLAAQLSHFKEYFFDGLLHLFRFGNLDYFDKVLQMIQPPRILLLGLLLLVTIFYSLLELFGNGLENRFVSLNYSYWLILLIISALTAIISVPKSLYTTKTFIALLTLPKGFILMIISLLKIKGATKRFIHTTHSHAGKVEKKH